MRYVLGVFGFIILAIFAVVLISTTTSDRSPTRQEGESQLNVTDFADKTATFSLTSQGKLVGQDEFRYIRINVTPSERRIQILRGYDEAVEREQAFGNTQAAYDVFVRALDNAGFSREREATVIEDVRGACPTGRRYIYQINESGKLALNLWSSTCGRTVGNFGGDSMMIQQIFKNQIPGYAAYVRDVRI